MASLGPGYDLFEFIDENPEIDSSICVFIFRQVHTIRDGDLSHQPYSGRVSTRIPT